MLAQNIQQKRTATILWYESLGFVLLILLSWLNELVQLPARPFRTTGSSTIHEAVMETVALVIVWVIVTTTTKRLLQRLYYLEGFLRVCAWCRKIGDDADWIPVEQYFAKNFDVRTSHGMCPECQSKWKAECAAVEQTVSSAHDSPRCTF